MSISPISTIALVTCDNNSKINFAHVVGEMRRSLDKSTRSGYVLTWGHDDIVTFDFESTRIVLSLADTRLTEKGAGTYQLLISVGNPTLGLRKRDPAIAHEQLCSTIVERVCDYYETKSVYWQQVDECVTAETVDRILERFVSANDTSEITEIKGTFAPDLPDTQDETLTQTAAYSGQVPSNIVAIGSTAKTRSNEVSLLSEGNSMQTSANDTPHGFHPDLDRLDAVRTALYEANVCSAPQQETKAPAIVRITATALDTTMIIVCLPVGAAMLTYHVFRGGELRRSSQMITLTGLFMASSKAVAAMQIVSFS